MTKFGQKVQALVMADIKILLLNYLILLQFERTSFIITLTTMIMMLLLLMEVVSHSSYIMTNGGSSDELGQFVVVAKESVNSRNCC